MRIKCTVSVIPEAVARANPDVVVREIEVDVKRQVGLAYSAARPASDVLQNFIAKLESRRPAARRGKRAAARDGARQRDVIA